jgi:hypothetical protein
MSQSPVLEFEDSQVRESGSCRAFKVRDGRREWMLMLKFSIIKKGSLGWYATKCGIEAKRLSA